MSTRRKRAASLEEAVKQAIEKFEESKQRVSEKLDVLVQRMRDSDPPADDEDETPMPCEVFAAGDVAKVLRAVGYLDDPLSGIWGRQEEQALEQYLGDQGVVTPFVAWFTTYGEPLEGGRLVQLCGDVLQAVHELARRVGVGPAAEPAAPGPALPPGPPLPPPAEPPRQEAGFAPERSVLAWLFLAAVVGGTYWVVRRERR